MWVCVYPQYIYWFELESTLNGEYIDSQMSETIRFEWTKTQNSWSFFFLLLCSKSNNKAQSTKHSLGIGTNNSQTNAWTSNSNANDTRHTKNVIFVHFGKFYAETEKKEMKEEYDAENGKQKHQIQIYERKTITICKNV